MLLYDSSVSGNCYKVRLLLTMQGVEFERRGVSVVDRSGRLELLGAPNPALRAPTLVLDDGEPPPGSAPRFLKGLFCHQRSPEPYIAVVRFWVCFAAAPPTEAQIEERRRGG